MFANEDEGFQELYDRLLACSSTKQSMQMSENKTARKDDPMDVDALQRKVEGKRQEGDRPQLRDCSEWWWSRGKGKGRVQGDEHADGR